MMKERSAKRKVKSYGEVAARARARVRSEVYLLCIQELPKREEAEETFFSRNIPRERINRHVIEKARIYRMREIEKDLVMFTENMSSIVSRYVA